MAKHRNTDTEDFEDRSGGTEAHVAVDDRIKEGYTPNAMNEGFASASGVRNETAETGGRIHHPETKDRARRTSIVKNPNADENSGLADN